MNGGKTVGPLALQRIGEALRSLCRIPTRMPFRLHSLVAQLKRMTKEGDYLHNAVEMMRLAEQAESPTEKARLVTLAEGWIELAERAHEDNERPRRPTLLHPLVEEKMGKLPD
jgi:hypothetical protein